jgi:hypothetical protein
MNFEFSLSQQKVNKMCENLNNTTGIFYDSQE